MEKRFTLFLVLSSLVLLGHLLVQRAFFPPPVDKGLAEAPEQPADGSGTDASGEQAGTGAPPENDSPPETPGEVPPGQAVEAPASQPAVQAGPAEDSTAEPSATAVPDQRVTLGSLAPNTPFRLLVTLNSRGAAIERIELAQRLPNGKFRYRELDERSGYLGHLALMDEPDGQGCRIQIVGPGTPAALAICSDPGIQPGLRPGDIIKQVDGHPVQTRLDFDDAMKTTKPGQELKIGLSRPAASEGGSQSLTFIAKLTEYPLSLIRPEWNPDAEVIRQDPLSCLLTLQTIGEKSVPREALEMPGLKRSLRSENWEMVPLDDAGDGPGVEFRFLLTAADLASVGAAGPIVVVKRYRLAKIAEPADSGEPSPAYHLKLEIEIRNLSDQDQKLAYRLDGPNGLPLEGWWYSYKIHPKMFKGAGARDIVFSTPESSNVLIGCPRIYRDSVKAKEEGEPPLIALFPDGDPQPLNYVGVDCQYFAVALKPANEAQAQKTYQHAYAMPVGDVGEKKGRRVRTTNVSFRLMRESQTIKAGESLHEEYLLFAGPKEPELLRQYGLERFIEYGWFPMIAKPLQWVLHFFESLPFVNFGFAIILLTVLVRSGMMPLSRKAAKNAQMMQALAPEMKKIAEKYKEDMQKRSAAQQELFRKHNYNPFGGCLLMFIQLPIFIGLYRALSVDIELRQAPLIDGLSWCSNLAGPDMLWYWRPYVFDAIGSESGWLGPYFNVLPLFTIALFLAQQKLFMPPATDDQTKMQQQMMKFMMIFMGVLFFKVASGLCIYFIASSLWGIAERKLMPPVGKKQDGEGKPSRKTIAEIEAKKARLKGKRKPKRS